MAASYITPDTETDIVKYTITTPVWVLVHDSQKVIDFRELKVGTLTTKQKVYVTDTEDEAQTEIDRLKLIPKTNKPK